MQLLLKDELPFTTISIAYRGAVLEIPDVLIDTGSASTVLSVDLLADVQIFPTPEDILHTIHGVGGSEVVFTRNVDYLKVGEHSIVNFEIEVGGMDYGFDINGILGMDFLTRSGAIINLKELKLEFSQV